jgi:MraZ protein
MYPARLDEKGRLKLPAVFQEYLGKFAEKRLFCTSLDRRIGQLYPISVWYEYQEFLDSYTEDPQAVQDVMFTAQDLGAEAEIDAQGRVTLNPELRKALDLQGQELHLMAYRGGVQILTHALYEARRNRAEKTLDGAVTKLEQAGLGKGIK